MARLCKSQNQVDRSTNTFQFETDALYVFCVGMLLICLKVYFSKLLQLEIEMTKKIYIQSVFIFWAHITQCGMYGNYYYYFIGSGVY